MRAEAIGGGLERPRVRDDQERVIVLPECNLRRSELLFHERTPVKIIGGVERHKWGNADDHRSKNVVAG